MMGSGFKRVGLAVLGYGSCWVLPPVAAAMVVGIFLRDAYDCSPPGLAVWTALLGWLVLVLVAYALTFGVVLAAADRSFMFRAALVVGVLATPVLTAALLAPSGVAFCS